MVTITALPTKVFSKTVNQIKTAPKFSAFITVWMVINLTDVVLTHFIIANGGREGNPIMQYGIDYIGEHGTWVVKLSLSYVMGLIVQAKPRLAWGVAWLYVPLLLWNSFALGFYVQSMGFMGG